MTRRSFFAAGGALGLWMVAACDSGETSKGSKTSEDGPSRIRASVAALAPQDFVATYRVDPAGGAGSHPTIAAAVEALLADKKKRMGIDGVMSLSNIWDWRRIEIAPGVYKERLNMPQHTAVVGLGSKPEDVHITFDGDNTLETTGRSCYVANVHLSHTGTSATAHPHRDGGSSGDVGLGILQRRTVVFEKVRFTAGTGAGIGKCSNDMVPRQGVSMVFNKCVFEAVDQPQSINLVTNVGLGTGAAVIAFIGCKTISNLEHNPDPETGKVTLVKAAPVGATDGGYGRKDNFLFMDGSWEVGTKGGVQALLVLPFAPSQDFKYTMKNVKPVVSTRFLVVNGGSVDSIKTTLSENGAMAPTAVIPADVVLPKHGVAQAEADYFGGKPTVSPTRVPTGLPAQSKGLTVAAGDTYWVRVPLKGASLAVQGLAIPGDKAPGYTFALYLDAKDAPDSKALLTLGTAKPGATDATCNLSWAYPGQGEHVWVAVTFTGAGIVGAVSAGAGDAWRSAGTSGIAPDATAARTAVDAGAAVPALSIVSQLPKGMA